MQISEIEANVIDQERGRLLELADPFSGALAGISLVVAGPDSDTARKAQIALADELAEVADADGRVTAEQREKARLNCLARHVLGWDAEEDGKRVTFSHAAILRLLRVKWVSEQVDAFAGDRRNFAPMEAA